MVRKLIGNKIFQYLFFRYTSFGFQLLNSVLIAYFLGPSLFGSWAFILLIVQYFNQLNFGIPQALNNVLSVSKDDLSACEIAYFISFKGILILNLLTILFFILQWSGWSLIGSEFGFPEFSWPVCLWIVTNQILLLLVNVSRIYGQLREINIYQLLPQLLIFTLLIFLQNEVSIILILWFWVISNVVSIAFLFNAIPIKFKKSDPQSLKSLIGKKGMKLFIYNSSFYLIMVVVRSLASYGYSNIEFGWMSFAFTCSNAVILLIDSFSFIAFPKLLGKFSKMLKEDIIDFIEDVKVEYSTIVAWMAFISIFLYAFCIQFLKEYDQTLFMFVLFIGAQIILSRSFGISIMLMAKDREKILALIAFFSLLIGSLFTLLIIRYFELEIAWSIMGIYLAYFSFSFLLHFSFMRDVQSEIDFSAMLVSILPLRMIIPLAGSILLAYYKMNFLLHLVPLVFYFLMNITGSIKVWRRLKMLLHSPKAIDL